ncbi:MAG: hypothetical protein NXI26_26420 [bacterium]|uniref:Uncharacterized protein n=1 Tax=Phaeodactylibacter xiamenensis TaxID=1524460 RepID=A0A098RXZ0_9BACT|nr:hypothetical protein [Phaeodactylibacter xiamenensis]KGE84795.1 hypothetical protein IX84_31855 [Phaeodactylibacter xiamenensis]MCR9055404.1 hypothetical protein [bacterium]
MSYKDLQDWFTLWKHNKKKAIGVIVFLSIIVFVVALLKKFGEKTGEAFFYRENHNIQESSNVDMGSLNKNELKSKALADFDTLNKDSERIEKLEYSLANFINSDKKENLFYEKLFEEFASSAVVERVMLKGVISPSISFQAYLDDLSTGILSDEFTIERVIFNEKNKVILLRINHESENEIKYE